MSFSRLAWRVMQENGGSTRQFISSTGTHMMLRKVIEQKTDGFHVFQKASDKYGFLKELDGMITEFKRHRVTPDMLKEQIDYRSEDRRVGKECRCRSAKAHKRSRADK